MQSRCAQCGAKFRRKRKDQRSCSLACRKLRYEHSAKARARKRRYEGSAKGKAAAERYATSSKGKSRQLRHYYKDRPGQLRVVLRNRAQWTKDIHRYAEGQGMNLLETLSVFTRRSPGKGKEYVKAALSVGWNLTPDRYGRFQRNTQRERFLDEWYWKLRREEERRTSSAVAGGL